MTPITFTTDKIEIVQSEHANRMVVKTEINLEFLLHQLPTDQLEAELRKRFKDSKMSGVFIVEPVPHKSDGSPAIFEFTDEPTRIAGVDFELPSLSIKHEPNKPL